MIHWTGTAGSGFELHPISQEPTRSPDIPWTPWTPGWSAYRLRAHDVRRSGNRCPEAFWSIRWLGLLLASLFHGRCSTLERWDGTITKHNGTRLSPADSTSLFLKEVSQNCLVFDLWRSEISLNFFVLELFHLLGKSQRICSFWIWQFPLLKEVSQNCFLSDTQIDG